MEHLILASHPTGDLVVGIPLGLILLWVAKILYQVAKSQEETSTILFGAKGQPGYLAQTSTRLDRVERAVSTINGGPIE